MEGNNEGTSTTDSSIQRSTSFSFQLSQSQTSSTKVLPFLPSGLSSAIEQRIIRRPNPFHPSSSSEGEEEEVAPLIIRPVRYRQSFIGRVRTIGNIDVQEWYFIFMSLFTIGVGLIFTFFRIANTDFGGDEFVFQILVLINFVFSLYYLLHGIFQELPFEIFAYILTTLIITGLILINFTSAEHEDFVIRAIRFACTLFLTIPNIVFGVRTVMHYWSSGPFVFKAVGGDRRLQKICRLYLFGVSLIMFDAQAMISCVILVVQNGFAHLTGEEISLLSCGVGATVLWTILGYMTLRKESLLFLKLFVCVSLVQPVYAVILISKDIAVLTRPYTSRQNAVILSSAILCLTHFILLALLPTIVSNFGKGLKETIYGHGKMNPQLAGFLPRETRTPTPPTPTQRPNSIAFRNAVLHACHLLQQQLPPNHPQVGPSDLETILPNPAQEEFQESDQRARSASNTALFNASGVINS